MFCLSWWDTTDFFYFYGGVAFGRILAVKEHPITVWIKRVFALCYKVTDCFYFVWVRRIKIVVNGLLVSSQSTENHALWLECSRNFKSKRPLAGTTFDLRRGSLKRVCDIRLLILKWLHLKLTGTW